MLNWFGKKKQKLDGFLSIHFLENGLAIAYTKKADKSGQIDLCDFIECEHADCLEVLSDYLAKHNLGDQVNTGIVLPFKDYRIFTLDSPNINEDEYQQAAKWLIKDLLDYPVSEAVIDLFKVPYKNKIYVVATRESLILDYIKSFKRLNLNIVAIDIVEFALRNILLQNKYEDCLLLFNFGNRIGLIVYKNFSIYLVRTIQAKLDEGQHLRLTTEVQRSLDYYQSQARQPLPKKIVLAPSLNQYSQLKEDLSNNLFVPVEVLDPSESLKSKNLSSETIIYSLAAIGESQRYVCERILQEANEGVGDAKD